MPAILGYLSTEAYEALQLIAGLHLDVLGRACPERSFKKEDLKQIQLTNRRGTIYSRDL